VTECEFLTDASEIVINYCNTLLKEVNRHEVGLIYVSPGGQSALRLAVITLS